MSVTYDFNQLANRQTDCSKKWDRRFIEHRYGPIPDDYLSMWIADLDFEVAPAIHRRFTEIINNKTFGYIYDYAEFYQAVIDYLKTKTARLMRAEEIMLDYSIVSSLHHLVQAFVPAGGKVLINSPVYNPFREAAENNQLTVIESPLNIDEAHRYVLDFKEMEAQFQQHQPEVYILCSPHNPGGRVWTRDELEQIAELCVKYDVLLVVDEAHSDHLNGTEFTSILDLPEHYLEQVVYLNSPNKTFNIAGLKTSYVVIVNEALRARYQAVLTRNHIDEPNIFGVAGLVAAYTPEGFEWAEQSYAYILDNYRWAANYLDQQLPQLSHMPMDSTYVMWIDVSATGMDGDEFTQQLATDTGVLVQEGSSFGTEGQNYIRLNLGTSKERVQEAFERMNRWLYSNISKS